MAQKISQITVGDKLVIQLDANPLTDGIGYDAPVGSIAMSNNGSLVKITGGPTRWHPIDTSFTQGGNAFSAFPSLILGSVVDKNMFFIRNNLQQIAFLSNSVDPDYDVSILRFPSHNLQISKHNANDNTVLNQSILISNNFGVIAPLEKDKVSLVFRSQAGFQTRTTSGSYDLQLPVPSRVPDGDDRTRAKRVVSGSLSNHVFNNDLIVPTQSMEVDFGLITLHKVLVMIFNTVNGETYVREKKFLTRSTNLPDRVSEVFFSSDTLSFNQDLANLMDFSLELSNEPISNVAQLTNNFMTSFNITGLVIGQSYTTTVWHERTSVIALNA